MKVIVMLLALLCINTSYAETITRKITHKFDKLPLISGPVIPYSVTNLQKEPIHFIIKGRVITKKDSLPLPSCSVYLKGISNEIAIIATSDSNGNYEIEIPQEYVEGAILVFSCKGFKRKEILINGKNLINVSLELDKPKKKLPPPPAKDLAEIIEIVDDEVVDVEVDEIYEIEIVEVEEEEEEELQPFCIVERPTENRESYSRIVENDFRSVANSPISTFSADVDNASYSNVRALINNGLNVPVDAVKIEEMINYFNYDYPQPQNVHPFSITTEYSDCPWQKKHKLLHIGLQGKIVPLDDIPASNLVFLIDVSGSMDSYNKLGLLKKSFSLLINNLREEDRVAIVVYAGAAGVVLESTSGNKKMKIKEAIRSLNAGGSTAGGEGIKLAYKIAKDNFIKDGNNRVILATDGDFNVGISNENELERLIETKRKTGVFLTCLGFGRGNYQDSKMETLSQTGNGNYAYIDNLQEAQKVLGDEFGGTIFTIAKDVKIQIEFNPTEVQAYRLIGYENRKLKTEDFKDDKKDAGELGSGHSVTAIYEIIPTGVKSNFLKNVTDLKYQDQKTNGDFTNELGTVKFRYKKPNGKKSIELSQIISNKSIKLKNTSDNFRFSASVALFGMLLRKSSFISDGEMKHVIDIAEKARGKDKNGYRAEFIRLAKTQKQ